jgi:hypothetical protein
MFFSKLLTVANFKVMNVDSLIDKLNQYMEVQPEFTKIFASVSVSTKTARLAKSGMQTNVNVNALLFSNAILDFCGVTIFADASAHKPKNAHLTSTRVSQLLR